MPTLLCCDVGTTQVKAAVFDPSGAVLASARRRVPVVDRPGVGRVQDAELFVAAAVDVLTDCVRSAAGPAGAEPEALVFTGQQAGLALVAEDGTAIAPYDSWLDTGYQQVLRETPEMVSRGRQNCGSSDFMHLPKLVRQQRRLGEDFGRVVAWTVAGPYVAGRLAGNPGREAFIDLASISYSGLADLETLTWDSGLGRDFGLDPGINPRIARPEEVVGGLTADYARQVGVPAGLPILAGVGDFPAATLGGMVPAGHCGEILGTASMSFGVVSGFPRGLAGSLRVSRSPVEGLWLVYDLVAGGDLVRWFCEDVLGRPASAETLSGLEADRAPEGLWFLPFGVGAPEYAGPWGWIGLDQRMNSSDMYLAMLEGVSLEQERTRRRIAGLAGVDPDGRSPVHVLGGSGGDNQRWLRMKACVAGRPYRIYQGPADPALVGAAAIGALALGWVADRASLAEAWGTEEREVAPDPEESAAEQRRLHRYLDVLSGSRPW